VPPLLCCWTWAVLCLVCCVRCVMLCCAVQWRTSNLSSQPRGCVVLGKEVRWLIHTDAVPVATTPRGERGDDTGLSTGPAVGTAGTAGVVASAGTEPGARLSSGGGPTDGAVLRSIDSYSPRRGAWVVANDRALLNCRVSPERRKHPNDRLATVRTLAARVLCHAHQSAQIEGRCEASASPCYLSAAQAQSGLSI
jgi:hypothetical protein